MLEKVMKKKINFLLICAQIIINNNCMQQPYPLWAQPNSCYINSITQCLNAIHPLTNFLVTLPQTTYMPTIPPLYAWEKPTPNLGYFYLPLIKALTNGRDYKRDLTLFSSMAAGSTVQACEQLTSQQDASELLGKFIDSLRTTDDTNVIDKINDFFAFNRLETTVCPSSEDLSNQETIPETYLNIATSKDKEIIPENAQKKEDFLEDLRSLEECLNNEFKSFILTLKTSKSEEEQDCQKIITLESTPNILVIVLKRYYAFTPKNTKAAIIRKSNHAITIPFELDIGEFVKEGQKNDPYYTYDLIASAVHAGKTGGGHYIAYVKYPTGWWYCSDTTINGPKDTTNIQYDLDNGAYILFYQKKILTQQLTFEEKLKQELTNLSNSLNLLEKQLQKK